MAGGRPTEYSAQHVKDAELYLERCSEDYEVKTKPAIKDGMLLEHDEHYIVYNPRIPTIEGLANYLGVHKDTVYDWEDKYPEFSDVIGRLRQEQADRLINNGLAGTYNPTIAKVLLTKHGYREGQEHTGADGKDLFLDDKEAKEKGKAAIEEITRGGYIG